VTESLNPSPKPSTRAAVKTAPKAAIKATAKGAARAAGKSAAPRKAAKVAAVAQAGNERVFHHPNLGLAPAAMTASHGAAAGKIRSDAARISAGALEAVAEADPTIRTRYDETGLRMLLRDGELLIERLAMCLAGGQNSWLTDYAEWIGPIHRRRGVPLRDLAALCAAIPGQIEPQLSSDELAAATRYLDAAAAVLNRNGRVGGDRHKRNALLKWMYRGV
jgi:hypothetical protein